MDVYEFIQSNFTQDEYEKIKQIQPRSSDTQSSHGEFVNLY